MFLIQCLKFCVAIHHKARLSIDLGGVALMEATRDGAPPIDLIDGEQLVQRLKELGLGVKITMIESVEIDTDWFTKI